MIDNNMKIISGLTSVMVGLSDEEQEKWEKVYEAQTLLRDQQRELEDYKMKESNRIKKDPKFYLGHFEVVSGEVMVSDPCYEIGTWCQVKLDNVENGQWNAVVEKSDEDDWGVRISSIMAYTGREPLTSDFVKHEGHVGVDSGQAGIFDLNVYRNNDFAKSSNFLSESRQEEVGEKWYSYCCDTTISDEQAGVIVGGAVSSSGYGDGGYDLFTVTKDNKIIAIKVVFISEEEDDEQ